MSRNDHIYAAIMAGGIGSRFWPKSRSSYPKQFLDILNTGKTLIQLTYERYLNVCPAQNICIITNEDYVELVKEQLPDLQDHQILREPSRRNTAPCIAYAAEKIHAANPNAVMIVSPSDHIILQQRKFENAIKKAVAFTEESDTLLTLGIKPSRPDTGYGYIQYTDSDTKGIKRVKTFTEKPTLEIAETFISSGDFLWNSGMFVWSTKAILKAFRKHLPEMSDAFKGGEKAYNTPKEEGFIKKAYSLCTNISIDYGIMEKADNVFVIPSDFGWSDVGTWKSLHEVSEKDYLDNAVIGNMVKIYGASNNMIVAPKNKLVVVDGLTNYCIIDTEDVLLIAPLDNEQEIKQITNDIKREDEGEKYL